MSNQQIIGTIDSTNDENQLSTKIGIIGAGDIGQAYAR